MQASTDIVKKVPTQDNISYFRCSLFTQIARRNVNCFDAYGLYKSKKWWLSLSIALNRINLVILRKLYPQVRVNKYLSAYLLVVVRC